MDNNTIFTKTAKGVGEAVGKTRALSRELRTVLKEVDGKASLDELLDKISGLSEAKIRDALNKLSAGDYIRKFMSPTLESDTLDFNTIIPLPKKTERPPGQRTLINEALRLQLEARAKAEVAVYERMERQQEERERRGIEEQARREAEEKARRAAQQQAMKAAQENAEREAEERARQALEAEAKRQAEEQARRDAEEAASRQEAEQQAAEEKARLEAEAIAKQEAEEQEKRALAEEQARRKIEEQERRLAEQRAREEAEEEARREAEEQARKDAEIEARRLADEQARVEAEQQARREAEEQTRHAAETRAKKEQEERRRHEAEQKGRQAEEENARREAKQRAKEDAEENARRESDERARQAAEEKARLEAEAIAKQEAEEQEKRALAEEQARREIEEQERRLAEQRARAEAEQAEQQARREAEEQAAKNAEAEVRRLANEQTRREAEEQTRHAEALADTAAEEEIRREFEELARQQAEDAARQKAAQARRQIEELAQRKAEEKAKKDEEKRARKELEKVEASREAEAKAKQEIEKWMREAAQEKARKNGREEPVITPDDLTEADIEDAMEPKQAEPLEQQTQDYEEQDEPEQIEQDDEETIVSRKKPKPYRKPVKWGKPVALGLFLSILLGLGLMHVIAFDRQTALFEKAAAAQFQQPVKIGNVYLSLVPLPHWRLEDVSIGAEGQITASRIKATMGLESLLGNGIAFKSLDLESPVFSEQGLEWLLFGRSQQHAFTVERINASNARLASKSVSLPPFNAAAEIRADGTWGKITADSIDAKTRIQLRPDGEAVHVELSANSFDVPFGSTLTLGNFNAKGIARRSELAITEFTGTIYDGIVSGTAKLQWASNWTLKGDVHAKLIDASLLAPELLQSGRLEGNASYALRAEQAGKLFATPHVEGLFAIQNGTLLGVDFAKLLRSTNSAGQSSFAELTGAFVRDGESTRLRKIYLNAGLLSVKGSADMSANQALTGQLTVELNSSTQQAYRNLVVAGTLQNPQFNR